MKTFRVTALLLTLAGVLWGFGTYVSNHGYPQAPSYSAQPGGAADPAAIIRQAGGTVDNGGDYTLGDGSWNANGVLGGPGFGENIQVCTLPADTSETGAQAAVIDDATYHGKAVIAGRKFYIIVFQGMDPRTLTDGYPVPLATIAARVHGTVLQQPTTP